MSILKIEMFGKQKSAMPLLFIDYFFPRFARPFRMVREPSPLHILSEMGCLLYLPVSTSSTSALILNFVKHFLLVISRTISKYGSS